MCIFTLKMHVMWFEIGHSQKCTSEHSQHAVHFFSVGTHSDLLFSEYLQCERTETCSFANTCERTETCSFGNTFERTVTCSFGNTFERTETCSFGNTFERTVTCSFGNTCERPETCSFVLGNSIAESIISINILLNILNSCYYNYHTESNAIEHRIFLSQPL